MSSWTTASCSCGSNGLPTRLDRRQALRVEQQPKLAIDCRDALDPADFRAARAACWRWRGRSRRRSTSSLDKQHLVGEPERLPRGPARSDGGSWRSRRRCAASPALFSAASCSAARSCAAQLVHLARQGLRRGVELRDALLGACSSAGTFVCASIHRYSCSTSSFISPLT